MTERIYFHVGYQKSASTWLQREFFPRLTDRLVKAEGEGADFFSYLCNSWGFRYREQTLRDKFHKSLEAVKSREGGGPIIFSEETIVGDFFYPSIVSSYEIMERLKALDSPDYKLGILMVIRPQHEILASIYKEYIKLGGLLKIDKFLYSEKMSVMLESMNYHEVISAFQDAFGRDQVKILSVRDFDYASSSARLYKLIEVLGGIETAAGSAEVGNDYLLDAREKRANVGLSDGWIEFERYLNLFCATQLRPGGIEISKAKWLRLMLQLMPFLTPKQDKVKPIFLRYAKKYHAGNMNLEQLISNWDCKELGFSLE